MPIIQEMKTNDDGEPEMPKWMDCAWRRIACEKDDCPICGRIKKDRQKHIEKGEDPDSIESAMEDAGNNFKEVLAAIKADAKAHGIEIENIPDNVKDMEEPPAPETYPLYLKLNNWRQDIYKLADESDEASNAWLYSEAGQDLLWYANTLAAKTYRQLSNCWHLERGDEYGDFDYKYTAYVLEECINFLKKALAELSKSDSAFKNKFYLALIYLNELEKEINNTLSINV